MIKTNELSPEVMRAVRFILDSPHSWEMMRDISDFDIIASGFNTDDFTDAIFHLRVLRGDISGIVMIDGIEI